MPRTATNCPRCRQPVVVDVEQLFDLNTDPQAKQRLLSGNYNLIHCANCGYEGNLATPLVYHDPEKELLLTYFPPELAMPVTEQERMVGPLITQAVNRLPNEKRKAYLFRPQTMLTQQSMIERILEADGITKEMLEEQQKKLNLLQRLLTTPPASRPEVIKQEQALVDASFFTMLNRLIEGTLAQNDQANARQLALLQQDLLQNTDFGRELQKQAGEAEEAVKALQEASKTGLTREKLLDMMINAPSPVWLSTLVSYTRSGMDYEFFNLLTKQIEAASNDEQRTKLTDLRDRLGVMTREIDKAMQEQVETNRQFLEELLQQPDIEHATEENLQAINELFVDLLHNEIQQARQKADLERIGKLQKVANVIEKASTPPPELALVEELMAAETEEDRRAVLESHGDQITPEFIELLSNLSAQAGQQEQNQEVVKQLQTVYRTALRFAMETNLKK